MTPAHHQTHRILAALVLGCLLVAAWITPPARAQDPATLTIGTTDLPTTLDPGEAYDFAAWEVLSHLYTGLTRQVPGTLNYEPALAEAITASDDGLTYTVTLREGAAFSDGTPITAQTFVDAIARTRSLRRGAAQAIEPYVESVAVDDEGRLVFTLTRPTPYFAALLALPPYFPQHPSLAATDKPQPFPDTLIGNGPYMLRSFAVRDEIVLVADSGYTLGPAPLTPRIVLRHFTRSQDLRDATRNGTVDLAWRALFMGDLLALERVEGLQVIDVPSTRAFYLGFNHNREPFEDPFAREGVTLLVERDGPVGALHGYATPLTSLVPEQLGGAYAPVWPDEPDVQRAEEILRAAAYSPRGTSRLAFQITFSQPTYGDTHVSAAGELVRRSFNASDFVNAGVFAAVEPDTFARALDRAEGQVILFGWTPIVPDPAAYLVPLAHSRSPIPRNSGYASEDVDALLDRAARADDASARAALYRDAAGLLLRDYALVPLWQDHIQVVAQTDVRGIIVEPNFFLHYDHLTR